jgi:Gpi18-like mannosyltransferase
LIPPWKTIIAAFVTSRLTCGFFAYLGHLQRGSGPQIPGRWEGVSVWWINPLTLYDSEYYLSIAGEGYRELTAPFFPLYPMLMRLGGQSETSMAVAGIIISNIALLAALYFLYRLTELDFDSRTAAAAVWLLAFYPTTAFFSAVYTESIFLLLLLLCFYSARKQRWMIAGLAGALASLSRNPGALIFVALGLEYLRQQEYSWKKLELPHLFFVSLPLVSFMGVQAYLWEVLGTPMAAVAVQQQFYRAPTWPWEPIWRDVLGFFTFLDFDLLTFVNILSIFIAIILAIRYWRVLRPSYAILLFGLILMNLAYALRIPPHTTGTIRYLSTAFPFIQLLGFYSTQPTSLSCKYRLASSGLYFYIFLLFSFLFGLKYFLG